MSEFTVCLATSCMLVFSATHAANACERERKAYEDAMFANAAPRTEIESSLDHMRKRSVYSKEWSQEVVRNAIQSARGGIASQPPNNPNKLTVAYLRYEICILGGVNEPEQEPPIDRTQQNQTIPASRTQAQANAQLSLESMRVLQAKAEREAKRRGRRSHDSLAEAHNCLTPTTTGMYGSMKNSCPYKVYYTFCAFKPRESNSLDSGYLMGVNCEKQQFGAGEIKGNDSTVQHTKATQSIHWFACRDPAWSVDAVFEGGQIRGRCRVVGE